MIGNWRRVDIDGDTPYGAFEETLRRAIESGGLDGRPADDPKLAGVFAAHRRLEALFALLRQPVQADMPPEPPPERLGRYVVRGVLGSGTFGTVYLADDPELARPVAVKVRRAGTFASPDDADKFLAEAKCAARLNHPAIVSIHDVGRDSDRPYIVMQYVAGRTLADDLAFQPPNPAEAAELLVGVADALHYAHKRGFVHRDLKPANILLDEHGRPHVADFGLAVSDETQRHLAGQIAGTPAYMSPEQVRGAAHHLDGRTDIWSLGVIGYQLLTGRQPFWQGDALACLDAIQHRDPKPPRQIDDTIPVELERIVLKCLAKQPTARYSTAGDLASDLRRWLRTQTGGIRTGRRALIAAGFILAAGLAVFGWQATSTPPSGTVQPLTGTIDVRLWNLDDPARRGLTLDEPGALPLRIGDQVRIEASVSASSYLYIVWIGADGRAHPVYPWRNGDWQDRPSEKPIARLSLPDDPTLGWPMSGSSGTETLLLLARRLPLEQNVDLRELLRGLPDILIDAPGMLVRLDEGKVAHARERAPEFSSPHSIDDAAVAAQHFLKQRLGSRFDTVRAISFAVAHRSETP
jgi:hypothetical protein